MEKKEGEMERKKKGRTRDKERRDIKRKRN